MKSIFGKVSSNSILKILSWYLQDTVSDYLYLVSSRYFWKVSFTTLRKYHKMLKCRLTNVRTYITV